MTSAGPSDPRMAMVERQLRARGIDDARVLEVMGRLPRERFVPAERASEAYADGPLPIGSGQTISQPYIVAMMTQLLRVDRGHRVLEVGTGSGYQTAVLCALAREVWSIERVKPLLDAAFERLLDLGIRNVHFRCGDGTLGWPQEAPFDRVLIAAAAPRLCRTMLLASLLEGGVAVLPVGDAEHQQLSVVRRAGSRLITEPAGACRFVPLIGAEGWPA